MKSNKTTIFITVIILIVTVLVSLSIGETSSSVNESLLALFGFGDEQLVSIVQNIRFPRIIAGLCVGATLSLSGVFSTIALKNELADSGILGVQSGATFVSLLIMLVFPTMIMLLPIAAFVGGMIAFSLVILFSYNKRIIPSRVVLAGVAVNAFFAALIGIVTILNAQELQSALSWLNGSLAVVGINELGVIIFFTIFALICTIILIPVLKMLKLDDDIIINLGKNPTILRMTACIFSVFLASVSVAFIGIISFVGILCPQTAKFFVKNSMRAFVIESALCGSILIVFADMVSRILFAPMEIPVGIVIGIISAPFFLIILRRNYVPN